MSFSEVVRADHLICRLEYRSARSMICVDEDVVAEDVLPIGKIFLANEMVVNFEHSCLCTDNMQKQAPFMTKKMWPHCDITIESKRPPAVYQVRYHNSVIMLRIFICGLHTIQSSNCTLKSLL